jgi:hypothetical protein
MKHNPHRPSTRRRQWRSVETLARRRHQEWAAAARLGRPADVGQITRELELAYREMRGQR